MAKKIVKKSTKVTPSTKKVTKVKNKVKKEPKVELKPTRLLVTMEICKKCINKCKIKALPHSKVNCPDFKAKD